MTTHDYYSIPLRFGLLIFILSCTAMINLVIHLDDCMGPNAYKCIFAVWALIGLVAVDILKNSIRQLRRHVHPPVIGSNSVRF